MKLVFYDRQTTPALPANSPTLTIEQKGTFGLSIAAVAGLGLKPSEHLALAQDAETNNWYLLLNPRAALGLKPFELRPRDSKSNRSLIFCSQPQARAYYAAHGLGQQKSVRASVVLEPVAHEGLQLYPLQPQHASVSVQPVTTSAEPVHETPESVQLSESEPVAEVSWKRPALVTALDEAPATEAPASELPVPASAAPANALSAAGAFTAEMDAALLADGSSPALLAKQWGMDRTKLANRKTHLKQKQLTPEPPKLVYTPAPSPEAAPQQKTFGLQARAEELANYWLEREISNAKPNELAEVLNVLRHVPTSKRGIEMSLVLDRAEAEHTHRVTAAGKGGNRG